jgi:hypothetical protein
MTGLGGDLMREVVTMQLFDGARSGLSQSVRVLNKHVLNPVMLRMAGRPHWYAARLEHVGRRSGRPFATPIVATEIPDGFVIPLPYGTGVDWLRNIQAAGGGALVVQGRRYTLSAPEVFATSEIYPDLPHDEQVRARVWKIGHWLRVKAVPQG